MHDALPESPSEQPPVSQPSSGVALQAFQQRIITELTQLRTRQAHLQADRSLIEQELESMRLREAGLRGQLDLLQELSNTAQAEH